jgi:hypothetical protein
MSRPILNPGVQTAASQPLSWTAWEKTKAMLASASQKFHTRPKRPDRFSQELPVRRPAALERALAARAEKNVGPDWRDGFVGRGRGGDNSNNNKNPRRNSDEFSRAPPVGSQKHTQQQGNSPCKQGEVGGDVTLKRGFEEKKKALTRAKRTRGAVFLIGVLIVGGAFVRYLLLESGLREDAKKPLMA